MDVTFAVVILRTFQLEASADCVASTEAILSSGIVERPKGAYDTELRGLMAAERQWQPLSPSNPCRTRLLTPFLLQRAKYSVV